MNFPKKVNSLLQKYDLFVREYDFSRKLIICFGNMIFRLGNITFPSNLLIRLESMISSIKNMNVSKKVNYLLLNFDFFIREYAKVTPKCDKLIVC